MKTTLQNAIGGLLAYATAHPHQVRWSAIGSAFGGATGLFIGSVAVWLPGWVVLAVLCGLIGNRFGSEKDGRPV